MSNGGKRGLAKLLDQAAPQLDGWLWTRRAVGRPRKPKKGQSLGDFLAGVTRKRARGRKKETSDAAYKDLLQQIIRICVRDRLSGRGAVKEALKRSITEFARSENISTSQALATHLAYFQKRISEAVAKFPDIAKQIPR